jgi:hypothetical protein
VRWRWGIGALGATAALALAFACGDFESDTTAPGDAGSDAPVAPDAGGDATGVDATDASDAANDAGRDFRYVFVTSGTHIGRFSDGGGPGLEGADSFCANQALQTKLEGLTWRAWLGTSNGDPFARISTGGKILHDYRLITGELIFPAGLKFIGGNLVPKHAIDRDENGDAAVSVVVWTGSTVEGLHSEHNCADWSQNNGNFQGTTAFTKEDNGTFALNWTTWANEECNGTMHSLYCFEVDP